MVSPDHDEDEAFIGDGEGVLPEGVEVLDDLEGLHMSYIPGWPCFSALSRSS